MGYESVLGPAVVLAIVIFISFSCCDLYGVALAAVGMLSTLSTALAIDAFGPVCDNAGGIAQMAKLDNEVRSCKHDCNDSNANDAAFFGRFETRQMRWILLEIRQPQLVRGSLSVLLRWSRSPYSVHLL